MLDQLLLDRFTQLINVRQSERRKQFPIDISQIDRQAAAHGGFHSSARILQIHAAHERELEVRSIIAWECLVRVHRTLGCPVSETIREDMKSEIDRAIDVIYKELTNSFDGILKKSHFQMPLSLDDAWSRCKKKHEIEADLYVDSIDRSLPKEGPHPMTQQYNFYGNVGAVQTGPNATANVVQNLGADDRAKLSAAIAQVREILGTDTTLAARQRQELIEIADECSTQIGAQSPNSTKLLSLFNVLGISIQSIASAQPAYQALKVALLPLGITLP